MGAYINVGIVFGDECHVVEVFRDFTQYLEKKGVTFTKVKYSLDVDGDNWVEHMIKENVIKDEWLFGYFTEFELSRCLHLQHVTFTIHQEEGYFGFLLDLDLEEVVSNDVFTVQRQLVECLIELYQYLPFEYSFIGVEIEIEVHPRNFEALVQKDHGYPVGLIGKQNDMDVYYDQFAIDGMSRQERRKERIPIEKK
ncbi:Imm64 family immunity protein [Bacillus sp. 179-C3.3 HS]|uniref:Imm64 family immunity protein n=1 Tax=Bacillus sp. 179-C3.3 HS TaxID=3232162 RepID=UPI0039A16E25